MGKKIYDKIYWHSGFLGIVEKSDIIIDRVEKEGSETGYNYYVVYFKAKGKSQTSWILIGKDGTGIEFSGHRRYMVDSNGELDIIGIKKYLYNREMSEVIDNL